MILDSKVLGRLSAVGFAGVGLVCLQMFGIKGWVFAAGTLFAFHLLCHPKWLLLTYWIWVTVSGLVESLLPSAITRWGDESVTGMLLFVAAGHFVLGKRTFQDLKLIVRVLFGLLALAGLSAFVNRVPGVGAAHFVLSYFRFFLLVPFTYWFLPRRDYKFVIWIIIGTLALQAGINFTWMVGANPLPNIRRGTVDFAIGTLQSCNIVAYLSVAYIALCAAIFNHSRRKRMKFLATILGTAGVAQLWITFTYHAYVLCVGCLGVQLFLVTSNRRLRNVIRLAALPLVLLLLIVAPDSDLIGGSNLSQQFSPRYIRHRVQRMVYGIKGKVYRDVLITVPRNLPLPILGAGPGNFVSAMGRIYRRPLAEQYVNYVTDDSMRYRLLSDGGSITGMAHAGALAIWSELGPFGYLLYWGIHVVAMLRVWRRIQRRHYVDPYQQMLAEAFVPTMLMWLALSFLADFAHNAFLQGGVWIWAACVWTPAEPEGEANATAAASSSPFAPEPAIWRSPDAALPGADPT